MPYFSIQQATIRAGEQFVIRSTLHQQISFREDVESHNLEDNPSCPLAFSKGTVPIYHIVLGDHDIYVLRIMVFTYCLTTTECFTVRVAWANWFDDYNGYVSYQQALHVYDITSCMNQKYYSCKWKRTFNKFIKIYWYDVYDSTLYVLVILVFGDRSWLVVHHWDWDNDISAQY